MPENRSHSRKKPLFDHQKPGLGERGIALLVTVSMISILVAVSIETSRQIRSSAYSAWTARYEDQLSWTAVSGVQIGMALLLEDKRVSKNDTLREDWADPEKIAVLLEELGLGPYDLSITITDELGKIQVNALVEEPYGHNFDPLQRDVWDHFLRPIVSKHEDTDINETTDIINSIKDWLDSKDGDAITGLNGAESDYYQDLDPPYTCGNGPLSHLDELLLVKGMMPVIYYGTEALPGIAPYLTVYGGRVARGKKDYVYGGAVNINTAPLPVVAALLPRGDEELAANIVEYRDEREGDEYVNEISSVNWYKHAPGCADITIKPTLLTLSSDFFRIESRASIRAGENDAKSVVAVVLREKNEKGKWVCTISSWHAD